MRKWMIFFLLVSATVFGQETARIMTYNLLQYDTATDRNGVFRTVVGAIDPDIIVTQEVESFNGVNNFLTNVLNFSGTDYSAGSFIDGPTSDNAIFYKDSLFSFVSNTPILTDLRHINQFKMVYKPGNDTLLFFAVHLKASQGSDNEMQRLSEVQSLRAVTDALPNDADFIVLGDMNVYRSSEPAYEALVHLDQGAIGAVHDPLNLPGEWHNNTSFSNIHTQSTRISGGNGSGGGLDDRFDQILVSTSINVPNGIKVVAGSYHSFGNDGAHFNQAINSPPNQAVSAEVANALLASSDHLPVVMELQFETPTGIADSGPLLPEKVTLYQNFPNPFNPSTIISYEVATAGNVALVIYDVLGRKVHTLINERQAAGRYEVVWNGRDFRGQPVGSGIYIYRIEADGIAQNRRMLLLR